jgi:hypothetical protein
MFNLDRRVVARGVAIIFVAAMAAIWSRAMIAQDEQSRKPSEKSATATNNVSAEGASGGGFGGAAALGGGGFGGGGFGSAPGGSDNWVQSGPVVLAVSKSGKTLLGYSARTGTWDKVRLEKPLKEFTPVAAGNEGVVVVGKRVYAFSGIVGRWDSVEVADAKEPPVPMVDVNDLIHFDIGSKMYMFSSITGRWSVADLSVDAD